MRGSLLVYRPDVFHRGVDLTEPGGARFLLNVSYKVAGHDWIGYHTAQSRVVRPGWTAFVEGSTPRELELFGFPPPGHPIWNPTLLDATAERYPKLDLDAVARRLGGHVTPLAVPGQEFVAELRRLRAPRSHSSAECASAMRSRMAASSSGALTAGV